MANPFDQFDTATASNPAANPFDSFDSASEKHPSIAAADDESWFTKQARQAGLAARNIVTGVTALPALAVDLVQAGKDKLNRVPGFGAPFDAKEREAYNKKLDAQGPSESGSQFIQNSLTKAGLPEAKTAEERIVGNIESGMVGGGAFSSLAKLSAKTATNPTTQAVLTQMGQGPAMQVAAGGTGAGAAAATREAGGGERAQMLAGIAGSLAPGAASFAAPAALRTLLRGTEENIPTMAANAKTFSDAGATAPSVGQVTGNRTAQAIESALSKIPGGAGPMAKAAEQEAAEIGTKAIKIADELSTIGNPANAGLAIEKGISGEGGFISRFKTGQKALYDKVDQYMPKQTGVDVSNTQRTLASLNADIPNAAALSKWFKSAKIQGIEDAMKSDIKANSSGTSTAAQRYGLPQKEVVPPNPVLPYESIKKLRSLVGAELEGNSLTSDVPRSKWKALYASLSQDLDNAAQATGNPEAVKAVQRANQFTRAGHARIDDVLEKVVNKDTPEEIFKTATRAADMEAGATKISSIMKSLKPAERDVVKSAFIRRMGRASASNQNAEGDVFSTQTFLTNWGKMSPQAKSVMFSGKEGETAASLNQIAKAAANIKEGSKVFANPSGTAPGMAQMGAIGGVAGALASGHYGTAATLLSGVAGANLSARLMTNPSFVKWLAKSTKVPPGTLPAAIGTLGQVMENEDDATKRDAEAYASNVTGNLGGVADLTKIVPVSQLIQNTQQQ